MPGPRIGLRFKTAMPHLPSETSPLRPPNVWVFEDQLRPDVASLQAAPPDAPIFMVESRRTFAAWPFHQRRLTFLVAAMRHFRDELRALGRQVHYAALSDEPYLDSLAAVRRQIDRTGSNVFLVARPSEHHTQAWLDTLPQRLDIEIRHVDNNLFLTDRAEFADWFGRQSPTPPMETFYRRMRVRHGMLLEADGKPTGGTWNLDKANRKSARAVPKPLPEPMRFEPDAVTLGAMRDVERVFASHPGSTAAFDLPVSRVDAQRAFTDFLDHRLAQFGDYEDAMLSGEPILFHSMLSAPLNAGLLEPLAMVRSAEARFRAGDASLNSVEGFVRQIIGWREFVYGIYQTYMPDYGTRNPRNSTHAVPDWFWTGDTPMNCLHQAIGGVVERAYSHHIQRLMVICNFATLAGLVPQGVNDWFYAMYVDSHDWVVTPNVVGMAMHSDAPPDNVAGGIIGTKPYISAGAYIDRMSDYCRSCAFDPKVRVGERACPFTYLFWTFLDHFGPLYADNHRMRPMLRNAAKIDRAEMHAMMAQRKQFIELHIKGRPASY